MPQAIHQFVAGFATGDAISNSARMMRDVFLSWGKASWIFCDKKNVVADKKSAIRDLRDANAVIKPSDIAILHLSIGHPVNSLFASLHCRKVIVYHNITPSRYFQLISPPVAAVLESGRDDLKKLNSCADLNLAVSAYNAAEMTEAGYRDVGVLPLPIDVNSLTHGGCDPHTIERYRDGAFNILFVGRFVPNKKLEDLVKVLYYLNGIEPNVRLIHVGSTSGPSEAYFNLVKAAAMTLGLQNVSFQSSVPQGMLNAFYSCASAFLCMSEHEGFCAPLVEAMINHVPVFAMATSAIPETLGGAGVLFQPPADYMLIAETIAEVLHNDALRSAIVARQDARVEAMRNRDLAAELRSVLSPLIDG